jgi:hypothetical protein
MTDLKASSSGYSDSVFETSNAVASTRKEVEMSASDDLETMPVSGRVLSYCPACGSDRLVPVVERGEEENVHFLCDRCARCWTVALGAVWRTAPPGCFGCGARERCVAAYEADG